MLIHNIKLSYRTLKKNKLYSFLNGVGYAIGFTVVIIIALFINHEMTVDRSFEDSDRIFRLISTKENSGKHDFEYSDRIKNMFPEIENVAPVQYGVYTFNIASERNFTKINEVISTTNSFFDIFNIELVEGFSDLPFPQQDAAVISQSLAQRLYGNKSPLGKTIDVGGFVKAQVTGVVKDFPENTSFKSEVFLNIENEKLRIMQSCSDGKCMFPANIYLKLQSSEDRYSLEEKISNTIDLTKNKEAFWLQPLTAIYYNSNIEGNDNNLINKSMVYLLIGIGLLILLLSIFNHVNFSLSLQLSKLRDTGIKKTNGAGNLQLVNYYIIENILATIGSLVLSIGLLYFFLPIANRLLERNIVFGDLFQSTIVGTIIAIVLFTILFNSLVPIILISKFEIKTFLSKGMVKAKGGLFYSYLSVFQIAVSIVLIVSVFVIQKQITYAKHADLGFENEHLVRIVLPGDFEKGDLIKQELNQFPFVKSSSLSQGVPGQVNNQLGSDVDGNFFWLSAMDVDVDFIKTLGLELIAGRDFRQNDLDKACIINEAALRSLGWENIEDKKFRKCEVVGLVKDFHFSSFHKKIEPAVLQLKNKYVNNLTLRLEHGNLNHQVAQIRSVWKKIMPDFPLDLVFYDAYFDSLYKKEERLGKVITLFSGLAILITLMGLTGIIFQVSINRTKEIGVRKVNGAKNWEVMTMLNKNFVKWVVTAFVISTPVSYYVMREWLQNFAYKTELSWWIFALAGLIALGIALLTVSFQSWKAATRNPVESLRYE